MKLRLTNLSLSIASYLILACLFFYLTSERLYGQGDTHSLSIEIFVSDSLKKDFKPDGRLFILFEKYPGWEPRLNPVMGYGYGMFAKNITRWDVDDIQIVHSTKGWDSFLPKSFLLVDDPNAGPTYRKPWDIEKIPEGTYYLQVFWDQNTIESKLNSAGNLYSEVIEVNIKGSTNIDISLSKIIPPIEIMDHELVKEVNFMSDTLTKWWGKATFLKAAILLPSEYYKNQGKPYPIRYHISGLGGRYTNVNSYMKNKDFLNWWLSGEAPQIINVYLDGEGPLGDCYQIDSEYGPYGYVLVHELIPHIEGKFRGTQSPETRFVSGCSTGGWASLALQLYYPDFFNGVFSYSPDPVDFSNFLLVNIYEDKNFYINEYSILQPARRNIYGEVGLTMKDLVDQERLISPTGHYIESRSVFGVYNQLYSPKDENGRPIPLFNQETGKIDSLVAEHWKKYDLLHYTKENWNSLGIKLQGKIYIWVGDMDGFYLNTALRKYDEFLKSTENPKSDAKIVFEPMKGHCQEATQINYIKKTAERLEEINCIKKE